MEVRQIPNCPVHSIGPTPACPAFQVRTTLPTSKVELNVQQSHLSWWPTGVMPSLSSHMFHGMSACGLTTQAPPSNSVSLYNMSTQDSGIWSRIRVRSKAQEKFTHRSERLVYVHGSCSHTEAALGKFNPKGSHTHSMVHPPANASVQKWEDDQYEIMHYSGGYFLPSHQKAKRT